jgi:integrase
MKQTSKSKSSVLNLPDWKARRFQAQHEGGKMPEQMVRRGKHDVWYADCRYLGVRIRDCLVTTDRRLAERRLAELKTSVEKGEYQSGKKFWNDLEVDYLKEDGRYDHIVRTHLHPFFDGKKLADIVSHDPKTGKSLITEYFRVKGDLPESSLKKHARVLRWIIQRVDKSFTLPTIIYRNKGFFQNRFMSESELGGIISFLDDQHQTVALVMAYTGLDLSDAIDLRWRDIDLKQEMIRTQRGKTGNRVTLPLTQVVLDVLRFRLRVRRLHDDQVFNIAKQGFQKAWKLALKVSGVGWNVRVKDLRHYFGSYLLNKGVDSLVIAELMGHSSVAMLHKRYGHFSDDTLKRAVSVFDQSEGCPQIVHK